MMPIPYPTVPNKPSTSTSLFPPPRLYDYKFTKHSWLDEETPD